MVITHPDLIHFGALFLNPIFAKKEVNISIGQTEHQILPNNTAPTIISGHQ